MHCTLSGNGLVATVLFDQHVLTQYAFCYSACEAVSAHGNHVLQYLANLQQHRLSCSWGGRQIGTASNIVFSNGLLDPWHGFGVLEDVSESVVAVVIPEGAHHLDVSTSLSHLPTT